jgi:hypothetical protein
MVRWKERKKKGNQTKKNREEIPQPIDNERKERKKGKKPTHLVATLLNPPPLHLPCNNRKRTGHALSALSHRPYLAPPPSSQIHPSLQTPTTASTTNPLSRSRWIDVEVPDADPEIMALVPFTVQVPLTPRAAGLSAKVVYSPCKCEREYPRACPYSIGYAWLRVCEWPWP